MAYYIRMIMNKEYKILFSLSEDDKKTCYKKLLLRAKELNWDCSNIVKTYYYECKKDNFYINECFAKNLERYICEIPVWTNKEEIENNCNKLFEKIYYEYRAYLNACESNYKIYIRLCELYKENLDRSIGISWYKYRIKKQYREYDNDCNKAQQKYDKLCVGAEKERNLRNGIVEKMMLIMLSRIDGFVK